MVRTKKITIRISEDELSAIDHAADERNMNRSQFIIDSALKAASNNGSSTNSGKIMVHLVNLSNLANEIRDEALKQPIQTEVYGLWQSLN